MRKETLLRESLKLKSLIERSLEQHKAQNIVTIDLAGKSDMADFMIVASGTSTRHVGALAKRIMQDAARAGFQFEEPDGIQQSEWVLMDHPLVVVHLFHPETREYYDIERMWEGTMPAEEMAEAVY